MSSTTHGVVWRVISGFRLSVISELQSVTDLILQDEKQAQLECFVGMILNLLTANV